MTDTSPRAPLAQTATLYEPGPIGTPRSVGLTILVTIVTFGFWTWYWSYANGEEIKTYRPAGMGGVAYLLFTMFLLPVTMFAMANEVERMYTDAGEDPRITTAWGLWFFLPIIGQIIWYIRIQNAINEFWQARGATMDPSLT